MAHAGTKFSLLLLPALIAGACGGGGGGGGAAGPEEPTGPERGMRIVYETTDAPAAAKVMQARFDMLRVAGVTGVTARADGGRVLVEFAEPREDLADRVRQVASREGRMTFHFVDDAAAPMRALAAHVSANQLAKDQKITTETDEWSAAGTDHIDVYLTAEDHEETFTEAEGRRNGCWQPGMPIRGGGKVRCPVTGRVTIERYIAEVAAAGGPTIPDDRELIFARVGRTGWRVYYTERTDVLGGGRVAGAEVYEDEANGQHTAILFDETGKRTFGEETTAHLGDKLVIAVDGEVLVTPLIETATTDGRLVLPPVSRRNAEDLAAVIASGPLPGPVKEPAIKRQDAGSVEENPLAP
jgi:preprotein translocase subunit SecD